MSSSELARSCRMFRCLYPVANIPVRIVIGAQKMEAVHSAVSHGNTKDGRGLILRPSLVGLDRVGDNRVELGFRDLGLPAAAPIADAALPLPVAFRGQPGLIGSPLKNTLAPDAPREFFPAIDREPLAGMSERTAGHEGPMPGLGVPYFGGIHSSPPIALRGPNLGEDAPQAKHHGGVGAAAIKMLTQQNLLDIVPVTGCQMMTVEVGIPSHRLP